MSFAVNLPHLLLLQNIELMLLTLIISSLVKDLSLQKMWSLLIVTLLIKPLMVIISLSKPKVKHTKKIDGPEKVSSGRGRTRPGDYTIFNACIEFTIIVDDEKNTKVARYFSRSDTIQIRSEEHTSELQSQSNLVCRLLLEKKK